MEISEFLIKLQEKPRDVRIKILWASVGISALVIFSIWLVSLRYLSGDTDNDSKDGVASQEIRQMRNEWSSVKNGFQAGVGALFETGDDVGGSPFDQ